MLAHAAVLAYRLPRTGPWRTWANVQMFSAGHAVAAGVLLCGLTWLWCRLPLRGRIVPSVLSFLVAWAVAVPILSEDLEGMVARLSGRVPVWLAFALVTVLPAAMIPLAYLTGRLSRRLAFRLLAAGAAIVGLGVNAVVLPLAYPGVHLWTLLGATLALAGVLTHVPMPQLLSRRGWLRALIFVALGITGSLSVAVWPPNATVVEAAYQPAAAFMPFLARFRPQTSTPFRVPAQQREWFVDRSRVAPTKPNARVIPKDAVVLMIGVDSMRADLLEDEKYRKSLPNMFRLRDRSVWFKKARSAGSSTAPAIASLFSSRYYSQLYWTQYKKRRPEVFPHDDPSPRFPELLSAKGIPTVSVDTAGWLLNEFAIVRGFSEEQSARTAGYPTAHTAIGPLNQRLRDHSEGPLFQYVHCLDAHSPYTSAGKAKTKFLGYVKELALVDTEIGRLEETLKATGLAKRAVWILYSDHGEAFGEHGMTFHATTLYDELLHVPLLIAGPGLAPRAVESPVSLVDIGPTVLDLFQLATPSTMMGQSLVPFLKGESPRLSRPILAESRLKRALVTPDGFKIVEDPRRRTLELYDLNEDPKELNNIFQSDDPKSQEVLGALLMFFDLHTYSRPGYKVPYRRW